MFTILIIQVKKYHGHVEWHLQADCWLADWSVDRFIVLVDVACKLIYKIYTLLDILTIWDAYIMH